MGSENLTEKTIEREGELRPPSGVSGCIYPGSCMKKKILSKQMRELHQLLEKWDINQEKKLDLK